MSTNFEKDLSPQVVDSLLREHFLWRQSGSSVTPEQDVENLQKLRALGYVE